MDGNVWECDGMIESVIGSGEEKRFLVAYEDYANLYDPVRLAKFYETGAGQHTVTFAIDVYNQIVETDETNNEKNLVFSGIPWQDAGLLEFMNLARESKDTDQDLDLTDRIGFADYALIQKYWWAAEQPVIRKASDGKAREPKESSDPNSLVVWEEPR